MGEETVLQSLFINVVKPFGINIAFSCAADNLTNNLPLPPKESYLNGVIQEKPEDVSPLSK